MISINKILLVIFPLVALNQNFVPAQTSELNQLIKGLQAKYDKMSSLAADFTQIYHAPGERARRESGHLLLKKPGRMRWDYNVPENKLFISNGKVIYEYVPADKFATKTSVKESDDFRAPFMFLLGRGNLRRDFRKIEIANESPIKAGNIVLRLVPKRAQSFRELFIEIEPQSLQISRLSLIDDGGGRSDFLFANIRENAPAGETQFIFKPPAGIEVRNND
jgi:outer membrane lipoprotein carrier protein